MAAMVSSGWKKSPNGSAHVLTKMQTHESVVPSNTQKVENFWYHPVCDGIRFCSTLLLASKLRLSLLFLSHHCSLERVTSTTIIITILVALVMNIIIPCVLSSRQEAQPKLILFHFLPLCIFFDWSHIKSLYTNLHTLVPLPVDLTFFVHRQGPSCIVLWKKN